jgi:hypothetical protein
LSSPTHLDLIHSLIDTAYEFEGEVLPDHRRKMYAETLERFTIPELDWAFSTFRARPPVSGTYKPLPKPRDIIALLEPEQSVEDEAVGIASAIWSAVPKFGRYKATEAYAALGETGAETVRQMGGWNMLCDVMMQADVTHWNAQLRDKAKVVIGQRRRKQDTLKLEAVRQRALGPKQKPLARDQIAGMGDILKQLPGHLRGERPAERV